MSTSDGVSKKKKRISESESDAESDAESQAGNEASLQNANPHGTSDLSTGGLQSMNTEEHVTFPVYETRIASPSLSSVPDNRKEMEVEPEESGSDVSDNSDVRRESEENGSDVSPDEILLDAEFADTPSKGTYPPDCDKRLLMADDTDIKNLKLPMCPEGETLSSWVPANSEQMQRALKGLLPHRTMCAWVPKEVLARNATGFHDWQATSNPARARAIAAIVGLMWSGTAKGIPAGNHFQETKEEEGERDQQEREQDQGDDTTTRKKKNDDHSKKNRRFFTYEYIDEQDPEHNLPMFHMAMQEIYDESLKELVGLRIWKFVFHKVHSDALMMNSVMKENMVAEKATRQAGERHMARKHLLMKEMEHVRVNAQTAGVQYSYVTSDKVYRQKIELYGGKTVHGEGMPFMDFNTVPSNAVHEGIMGSSDGYGGKNYLAPEVMFNARRTMGFTGGSVPFDSETRAPHPDYLDNTNYFEDDGVFHIADVVSFTTSLYTLLVYSPCILFMYVLHIHVFAGQNNGGILVQYGQELYDYLR